MRGGTTKRNLGVKAPDRAAKSDLVLFSQGGAFCLVLPRPLFSQNMEYAFTQCLGAWPVPEICLTEIAHQNLGDGVTRVLCKANGLPAKRLTQIMWGNYVNQIPVWHLDDRIVADWFAELLEAKYQQSVSGQTVIFERK